MSTLLRGRPLESQLELASILQSGLEAQPDEVALASRDDQLTWRALDAASSRLAENLRARGLASGDRVAALLPNCPELVVFYLACFRSGLVAVPLNYRYHTPSIDHALETSGAALLIAHDEREAELEDSAIVSGLGGDVVKFGAGEQAAGTSLESLIHTEPASVEVGTHDPADPAAIFFTSGSTGPAKGVTHSRETLGWIFASVAAGLELSPGDIYLTGSSMSHMGAFMCAFGTYAAGGRVVVATSTGPHELLILLREQRPSVLSMIPAALTALLRDHDVTRDDFSSLRLLKCAADKASLELETEFVDLCGLSIDEAYGMTEIGEASINPPSGLIKRGSIGRPIDGFTFAVRDEEGSEVGPGTVGRAWVKTPTQMVGYWRDAEASRQVIRDGWLDTGDLMSYDEDGYLWFFGRKKQIIVHDGSNISPLEVEDALSEHPSVEISGVVGIHNAVHGENVRAYVKVKDGSARPTSQEIIDFARTRIGYRAPDEIVFVDDIPLNATGKVDRVALKEMAQADVNPHDT
jgi:long-chain acyl-CoA synthetase